MAAKNDITGDSIKTKTGNPDAYAKGWGCIFGNKNKVRSPSPLHLFAGGVRVSDKSRQRKSVENK